MEKAQVYLFTSPTCPHCPPAKQFIEKFKTERTDFDFVEVSGLTPGGQKLIRHFEVRSVPTFIIKGPGHGDYIGLKGVQSSEVMHKYLDMAMGKERVVEETVQTPKKEGFKLGKFRIRLSEE